MAKDHENIDIVDKSTEYPITVNGIQRRSLAPRAALFSPVDVGHMVSIRPLPIMDVCDGKTTYLGIYLGEMAVENIIALHKKEGILVIQPHMNPAIFVPDLNRIIYGYESWWGEIESEEKLRTITDEDIQNIWYVKALKEIGERAAKESSN